ncbi:DUF2207 domain-containing protein [Patescibacteria group bacterium]
MKKLLLSLFAALFLLPSVANAQALDHGYSWDLPEFIQNIEIKESGKILVEEKIIADFTREAHHGIYREIPVSYRNQYGNPFNLKFKLISVTDENGNPHPIAQHGKEWDNYLIKIGSADVELDTKVTYNIKYEIDRALGYFGNHDELYWNAYTDWEIPVLYSEVNVKIPKGAVLDDVRATCYTGSYGSTETNCSASFVNADTISIKKPNISYPYDAFTIVTGWPKGLVAKPNIVQEIFWFVQDNWALLIPLLVFLGLFFKWWYTGRDPKTKDTIIPRYKPPEGLTPTEVGTIIDEQVDLRDISAVIIDYAVKGYIKITEIKTKKAIFFDKTDYELTKLKEYMDAPNIKPHEKDVLGEIFKTKDAVKLSSLKYKFYRKLKTIKEDLYKDLVKDKFFVHNPENVRATYIGIGGIILGAQMFVGGLVIEMLGWTMFLSLIASGIMIIAFGRIMPRKSLKGARALVEIKGLEEYIRTAEKDRIKFQEDQNLFFEKLLPYAMVLGLGDKWAGAFKDIYKKPPAWFDGADVDGFDSYRLVNRLNNFNTHATTAFASSPRSSGGGGSSAWSGGSGFSGGFSGGGFGGGGGGGW